MSDGRKNNGRYIRGLTPQQRFNQKYVVNEETGCWEWIASLKPGTAYGCMQVAKRTVYAHRLSHELHIGPIPSGMQIDHLCRNRSCVNPDHLEAVEPHVNVRRGMSPGAKALRRDTCIVGHSYSQWGVLRHQRRYCRLCESCKSRERRWRAQRGIPVAPLDRSEAVAKWEAIVAPRLMARPLPPVPTSHRGMPVPQIVEAEAAA